MVVEVAVCLRECVGLKNKGKAKVVHRRKEDGIGSVKKFLTKKATEVRSRTG